MTGATAGEQKDQLRVLIATDRVGALDSLIRSLSDCADVDVIAVLATRAITPDARARADVLVLDVVDAVEAVRAVRAVMRAAPMPIVVTIGPPRQDALPIFSAGGRGVALLDDDPDVVIDAVRAVAAGGMYMDSGTAAALAKIVTGRPGPPNSGPSTR